MIERIDATGWRESDRVEAETSLAAVAEILEALAAAEPAAPFLGHYGPGNAEPYVPAATASAPWARRR